MLQSIFRQWVKCQRLNANGKEKTLSVMVTGKWIKVKERPWITQVQRQRENGKWKLVNVKIQVSKGQKLHANFKSKHR